MRLSFMDDDHEFSIDLPRRPKKGTRLEHEGEEYIVDRPRIIDGREIIDVRGPRSMQAAINSMTAFANLRAADE